MLRYIISQLVLIDLWKSKHDNVEEFTWCDAADIPKRKIDYAYLSTTLTSKPESLIYLKFLKLTLMALTKKDYSKL